VVQLFAFPENCNFSTSVLFYAITRALLHRLKYYSTTHSRSVKIAVFTESV
jgi:hypothetical protein